MRTAKTLLSACAIVCLAAFALTAAAWAEEPDAQVLLATAVGALDPAAQRVRYEVRAFDGKGGETGSAFLVVHARTDAGAATLGYLRKSDTLPELGALSWPGKDGAPELYLLAKGKSKGAAFRKAQEPLGKTDVRFADLLALGRPDKAAIVGRVIFNGARCWIVRAEYPARSSEYRTAQVWIREDDPAVLQIEWRDRKDRPVHQVRIVPKRTADGVLTVDELTCRNLEKGSWTVLKAQAVKPDLGTPPAVLTPALLADPKALDALWP